HTMSSRTCRPGSAPSRCSSVASKCSVFWCCSHRRSGANDVRHSRRASHSVNFDPVRGVTRPAHARTDCERYELIVWWEQLAAGECNSERPFCILVGTLEGDVRAPSQDWGLLSGSSCWVGSLGT